MSTSDHDRQIGRLVGGRYRLVSLIGAGGMGAVYRAVHTQMAKDFAVKLLRPELSRTAEATRRFQREAEAASRLAHPSCVRVTDFGRDEDTLFLVMERLAGRTLSEVLAEAPRLAPARAVHIAAQILDAVGHAHAQGVVHRDLKPDNVMLAPLDGDPDRVKICDFGIARLTESGSITDVGSVFGTPEYLSPEQALGEPADGRADLYAIGVLLYEMLVGRRPFAGLSKSELIAAHLTRDPPRIVDSSIPAALEQVVLRALAKRKGDRWQTAAEFQAALLAAPAPSEIAVGSRPPAIEEPTRTVPLQGQAPASAVEAAAPASAPVETAAPASVVRNATPAPRPRVGRARWLVAAGALVALIVVVAIVVAAGSGVDTRPAARAPDDRIDAARAALRSGATADARAAAETLARAFPADVRVFLLLGDALFAHRDAERGLAAYREAARMERDVAARHAELLANLRATFADRRHGEAAFALASGLGPPAASVLEDFAAKTGDASLRRRARAAAASARGDDP